MQVPLAGLNPLANPEVRPWAVGVPKTPRPKNGPFVQKTALGFAAQCFLSSQPDQRSGQGGLAMKSYLKTMLIAAGALTFTPLAASAGSIVSQGVTFSAGATANPDELVLTIDNALSGPSGSDNWLNITRLAFFAVKPASGGSSTYTGVSVTANPVGGVTWSGTLDQNLSNFGCNGGSNGAVCFTSNPFGAYQLTDHVVFDILFTGPAGFVLDLSSIHLQVGFLEANTPCTAPTLLNPHSCNAVGDLLSQDIAVPGPIVGAGLPGLIFACGGLLGLARHRRRRLA
jgi:hypothetical protein